MHGSTRSRHATPLRIGLVLAFASTLAACDTSDAGVDLVAAQSFEEGVGKSTEDGAFRVVLTSEDGLAVGANTLYVHLGFHDPDDAEAPGRGIPAADVLVEAWMPYADGASEARGVYVGDGIYAVELDLRDAGVWQLDLEFAVGHSIDDAVSFAFVVGE